MRIAQKYAFIEKPTIFTQLLKHLIKISNAWVGKIPRTTANFQQLEKYVNLLCYWNRGVTFEKLYLWENHRWQILIAAPLAISQGNLHKSLTKGYNFETWYKSSVEQISPIFHNKCLFCRTFLYWSCNCILINVTWFTIIFAII